VQASARFMDGWGKKKTMSLNINENCSELNQFFHKSALHLSLYLPIHHWNTFGRTGYERAVGRPRPEPGLLTPGSRPPPRTSLVCSLPAPGAVKSRVFLKIPMSALRASDTVGENDHAARCLRAPRQLQLRALATGPKGRSLTCWAKSQEPRACCRPTETGAGTSDARIAAAASDFTGVFFACAWCREISRTLEDPIGSVNVGT